MNETVPKFRIGPTMNLLTRISALALLTAPSAVWAQAAPDLNAKLAALEAAAKSAQSAGDNAWMLVSAALVLMMTGPGLALFYGGLVRRKNVLGTMMHSFILMAVVTVIWAVVGYSLAFGGASPFIGDLQFAFLDGVGAAPNADYAATIPHADLHGLPVDVRHHHAGADLRRLRRAHEVQRHAAVHDALDADRLLPDGAHGVGQGRTAQRVLRRQDSRASISPAARWCTSPRGVSALVCALYLGKRVGYPERRHEAAQPGAQRHRRVPAVGGLVRLQRRQRAGGHRPGDQRLRRHALRRRRRGARLDGGGVDGRRQAQRAGRHLGRVAGLVAITPGVRFRQAVAGAADRLLSPACVCYFMVTRVKRKFGYDDALDAFGVHGAGGTLGAHPHRRLRHQRGQRRAQGRRRQSAAARPGGWQRRARC